MLAADERVHASRVAQRDAAVDTGAGDGAGIERHRRSKGDSLEAIAAHRCQAAVGENEDRAERVLIDGANAVGGQAFAPRVRTEAISGAADEAPIFCSRPQHAGAILKESDEAIAA